MSVRKARSPVKNGLVTVMAATVHPAVSAPSKVTARNAPRVTVRLCL